MTGAASCSEVFSSSQSQECASSTVKQGSWPPDVPNFALLLDSSFFILVCLHDVATHAWFDVFRGCCDECMYDCTHLVVLLRRCCTCQVNQADDVLKSGTVSAVACVVRCVELFSTSSAVHVSKTAPDAGRLLSDSPNLTCTCACKRTFAHRCTLQPIARSSQR